MKFSVIVPVYNNAALIHRCLSSVLNQSFKDFELIVVDDGSTDSTQNEILKYRDERVVYIKKENGGVSSARNTGIAEAKGEYVCFLDSDDEYLENHLYVLNGLTTKYPNAGIYATSHITVLLDGKKKNSATYLLPLLNGEDDVETEDGFLYILKAKSDIIHTNSICIRKSCLDNKRLFCVGVNNGEDLDVWYRMIGNYSFVLTKVVTTIRHREDSRLSRSKRFIKNPVYLNGLRSIIDNVNISHRVRKHARYMVYRYLISEANNEILCGNRRNALKVLSLVKPNIFNYKKLFRAYFCLFVPNKTLLHIYANRRDSFYA